MKTNTPDDTDGARDDILTHERELLHRVVLTAVSHDLKVPLANIIGSLETYERTQKKFADNQKVLFNTALQEAYRLNGFINNILDMARLEAGAVKLRKVACSMDKLLEECLAMLGRNLINCTVTIQTKPVAFTFVTDPMLLKRAICIILDNASKYGAAHPVIGIKYEKRGEQVVIRIRDNGPGIAKSRLKAIFSKYERYSAQERRSPGTGLGLAICREIMRLLGGTVTASNIAGNKGAVFTLSLQQ